MARKFARKSNNLSKVRLDGQSMFWMSFPGWPSSDYAVDLRNPLQAVPECMAGKPFTLKHKKKSFGFNMHYQNVSKERLSRFMKAWRALISKIDASDQNDKSWKTRFMVCAQDGLWYRAKIKAHYVPIPNSTCFSQIDEMSYSLTDTYSANIGVDNGGKNEQFTIFCRGVYNHLKPVTKNSLLKNWVSLISATWTNTCKTKKNCCHLFQALQSREYGLLCALSHDTDADLCDQIAAICLYRLHSHAHCCFVELLYFVIAPQFDGKGLDSKILNLLCHFAKLKHYDYMVVRVPSDENTKQNYTNHLEGTCGLMLRNFLTSNKFEIIEKGIHQTNSKLDIQRILTLNMSHDYESKVKSNEQTSKTVLLWKRLNA